MKIKRSLTLALAQGIANKSLDTAKQTKLDPVCVAVLDSGGHPVVINSQDGCGVLRYGIAIGKAYGALGMGTSSRDLGDRLEARPNFASALASVSEGRFVANPGGVLIVDKEGTAIGAVGISGDTSEKDEFCAICAVHDAGYESLPAHVDTTRIEKTR